MFHFSQHEYAVLELSQNRNVYPELLANELQEFQDQAKCKGACFLLGLPVGERTERTEGGRQLSPESVLPRKPPGDDLLLRPSLLTHRFQEFWISQISRIISETEKGNFRLGEQGWMSDS